MKVRMGGSRGGALRRGCGTLPAALTPEPRASGGEHDQQRDRRARTLRARRHAPRAGDRPARTGERPEPARRLRPARPDRRRPRRGLAPGRGHAARRGRRAGRRRGPRRRRRAAPPPSSRSSRATTPAAPVRAPRRCSPPGSRASSCRSRDPNPVAAGGAERLRAAGVDVETGVLADEGRALLGAWLPAVERGRPFVTLKLATSLDGRVAAADGSSRWITSEVSRHHAHDLRAEVDAIVVGTGTALVDDPSLTARNAAGELHGHQPLRVVVGHRDLPAGARLRGPGGELVHVRTHDPARGAGRARRARGPARPRRGRPHAGRRVPRAPGSSTRCTPTSRPSCSAPAVPPWRTSASPPSATPSASPPDPSSRSVPTSSSSRPSTPDRPAQHHGGALMFTGIVEEIGTVEAIEHRGDGHGRAPAGPRTARRVRRPPGRLDQRLRRLSDGHRAPRRRHVLRGRHAGDPAAQRAGGRRRVQPGQPRARAARRRPVRRARRPGARRRRRHDPEPVARTALGRRRDRARARSSRGTSPRRGRSRSPASR